VHVLKRQVNLVNSSFLNSIFTQPEFSIGAAKIRTAVEGYERCNNCSSSKFDTIFYSNLVSHVIGQLIELISPVHTEFFSPHSLLTSIIWQKK
jgi:hypothetical protein